MIRRSECTLCWANYVFNISMKFKRSEKKGILFMNAVETIQTFVSIWSEVDDGFCREKVQTAFLCYVHLKNENTK